LRELITGARPKDEGMVVATPYEEVLKAQENRTRYQAVDPVERQRLGQRGREVQEFRLQRQKVETGAGAAQPDKERRPARVKLPRSPVVARPADQLGPEHAAPQRHEAPAPDLKVEPKPRQPRGESGAGSNANDSPQGKSQGKREKKSKE
jgi:hypothetical protein